MSETETGHDTPTTTVPETIAETSGPRPAYVAPDAPSDDGTAPADYIPGWPQVRYHPVHGERAFADPNDYAKFGGDEGDYRFRTAGEADAARTGPEADLVVLKQGLAKLQAHEDVAPVIHSSVQAHESAKSGFPESGVSEAVKPEA